jgi:hypothetical protein
MLGSRSAIRHSKVDSHFSEKGNSLKGNLRAETNSTGN